VLAVDDNGAMSDTDAILTYTCISFL